MEKIIKVYKGIFVQSNPALPTNAPKFHYVTWGEKPPTQEQVKDRLLKLRATVQKEHDSFIVEVHMASYEDVTREVITPIVTEVGQLS